MKHPARSHQATAKGFTLIEVLVVTIIVGILAAIAAPGWLSFLNRQRVSAVRSDLIQLLRTTQQDAIQRRQSSEVKIVTAAVPTVNVRGRDQVLGSTPTNVANLKLNAYSVNSTTKAKTAATSFTFDHQGLVNEQPLPLVIEITAGGSSARQCVVVASLLGTLKTAEGTACDNPGL